MTFLSLRHLQPSTALFVRNVCVFAMVHGRPEGIEEHKRKGTLLCPVRVPCGPLSRPMVGPQVQLLQSIKRWSDIWFHTRTANISIDVSIPTRVHVRTVNTNFGISVVTTDISFASSAENSVRRVMRRITV